MSIKDNFIKAKNRITGELIEERVNEYSEIYGEILLGMNREIESSKRQISEFKKEMNTMSNTIESLKSQLSELQNSTASKENTLWKTVSVIALMTSILSIGVSLWIAK